MKTVFFWLTISAWMFTACDDERSETEQYPVNHTTENFTFPDSILRKQIVATFYDVHNPSNGAIYLTDTLGKNALMLRFMPNGQVHSDSLWRKSAMQFISIRSKAEYVIGEKAVNYFSGNFGSEQIRNGQMYLRTDNLEQ